MAAQGRRFIGNAFDRRSDLADPEAQARVCDDLQRLGVNPDALFKILQRQAILPRILEAVDGCAYWSLVAPFYDQCVRAEREMITRFRRAGYDPDAMPAVRLVPDFLENLSIPFRTYGWIMRPARTGDTAPAGTTIMKAETRGRVAMPPLTPRGVERLRRALMERYLSPLRVSIHQQIASDLTRPARQHRQSASAHARREAVEEAARPAARLAADFLRAYLPDLASETTPDLVRRSVRNFRARLKTRKVTR
jgi:hypothetical protein